MPGKCFVQTETRDSQHLLKLTPAQGPPFDLVHVDGAHDFHGKIHDLMLAWMSGAGKIKTSSIILPNSPEFRAQALSRKTRLGSNGKAKLESKRDMKKRNLPSPDEGDAVYGCMMPPNQAQAVQFGGRRPPNWNEMVDDITAGRGTTGTPST